MKIMVSEVFSQDFGNISGTLNIENWLHYRNALEHALCLILYWKNLFWNQEHENKVQQYYIHQYNY